jgi:ABC-type transport system involved in multi-copper enzyme maturation permease subunit
MEGELLMKTARQILAIAWTEFRFGFRRGGPVVIMALVGVVIGVGILLMPIENIVNNPTVNFNNLTPDQVAKLTAYGITVQEFKSFFSDMLADMTIFSATMAWSSMLLTSVLLPPATAPSIPADRKFGVAELLHSTPITGVSYLAGKILGVLAVVLLMASITLSLFFIAFDVVLIFFNRTSLPGYLIYFYLKLSFMDGLPLLVWASAIGVLTGVVFSTRRGVIIPALVMGALSTYFWGLTYSPVKSFSTLDVAATYVFQNYHSTAQANWLRLTGEALTDYPGLPGGGAPAVDIKQVLLMYGTALLVLLVLAILARLWLKWKENF